MNAFSTHRFCLASVTLMHGVTFHLAKPHQEILFWIGVVTIRPASLEISWWGNRSETWNLSHRFFTAVVSTKLCSFLCAVLVLVAWLSYHFVGQYSGIIMALSQDYGQMCSLSLNCNYRLAIGSHELWICRGFLPWITTTREIFLCTMRWFYCKWVCISYL